ncbi:hypothetical protein AVEN_175340-1 [Araneus ventricosus]|uniref:Uncharacterized protein n=1 Tax=Araneus ventricosus TaxID=182803 RepID=A0A4Y2GXH6_ARAVE|nr:hypothetical protein AVEN_175340-1 [Araneus ventricosus]
MVLSTGSVYVHTIVESVEKKEIQTTSRLPDYPELSRSSAGSTVSVPASEPGGREFYPGLCSCSVFAIICNEFDTANLLQVRFMVTSELSLTCCKLTASLHTCHDKFVANLHSCHDKFVASLLQTKIAIWAETSHFAEEWGRGRQS